MPLVVIQHRKGNTYKVLAETIGAQMPEIVANALDAPAEEGEVGRLTAKDIEVWPHEASPFGVNTKDIEIVIWANDYPSRRANLEQRKDKIIKAVRKILRGSGWSPYPTGFVWVLLQPGAFGTL